MNARSAAALRRCSIALALGGLRWSAPALADGPPPLGTEFQINAYTTDWQAIPAVAMDPEGSFVVVWASYDQDGGPWSGVFGQRYDAGATPLGEEFQVNTYTTGPQYRPAVATGASGDFVVVWQSFSQDGSAWGVFGQRYDAGGEPAGGEFQVNTYTTSHQYDPRVAADASGNFVVVWTGADGFAGGIFGQRYDATGAPLGGEFQVNTYTTGSQGGPAVAVATTGDFVVVWVSFQDGSAWGVFGQRFDASGNPLGTEFQVNSHTIGSQLDAKVAAHASGTFVVVWKSGDGSDDGIFGQRYDAAGNPVGREFLVNSYTPFDQSYVEVAGDASGSFVVVWSSDYQDGSDSGIFGQRYDAAGNRSETEFQVNTYTSNDQRWPSVAADASGDFVVAWSTPDGSIDGVFGQRFWGSLLFADGFESGDTSAWDEAVP